MVGVNNRNLGSFVTDVENSFRIARQLREATHGPASPLLVSESGISDPETICRLRAAGFRGFLIGETFMKTANPGETLKEFIQALSLIHISLQPRRAHVGGDQTNPPQHHQGNVS